MRRANAITHGSRPKSGTRRGRPLTDSARAPIVKPDCCGKTTINRCNPLTPNDSQDDTSPMEELSLRALEARLDELIRACEELTDENRALRDQQAHLMAERAALIEKSELARSRVEAMIARLKAMEIGA